MSFPVTGVAVSAVPLVLSTRCFGTRVPAPTAHHILDAARDQGVVLLDAAGHEAAPAGDRTVVEAERCLGRWLRTRPAAAREAALIATEVHSRPGGDAGARGTGRFAPAGLRDQVTASLLRLGVERIGVLHVHVHAEVPAVVGEVFEELGALVTEGLVATITVCNPSPHSLYHTVDAQGRSRWGGVRQRFTYLRPNAVADFSPQTVLDEEGEAFCRAHAMVMFGCSPLLSGAYTRLDRPIPEAYRSEATIRSLAALESAAAAVGRDAGQVVLAWMVQRDPEVHPVLTVSSVEQVSAATSTVTAPLPTEVITALESARTPTAGV